ncbi:hypothetical protein HK096_007483, partial [Nowakowskiella sp. JEL0078]
DPSRDAVMILACHKGLQTVMQSGIWPDPSTSKYTSSGVLLKKVQKLPMICKMVGLNN